MTHLWLLCLACCVVVASCATETITGTIYADNYFEFYVNGVLVKTDPLDFTPHNAVKFSFTHTVGESKTYAVKAKDFATPTGYEYTNTSTPQLGDGALRIILSDGTVTNKNWKCFTTNYGPTAASITAGCSATNLTPCALQITAEPTNWTSPSFDHSSWSAASEFTEAQAGWGTAPTYSNGLCGTLTDGYTRQTKNPSAISTTADECLSPRIQTWGSSVFIWQGDLEKDNTILCRLVVSGSVTPSPSAAPAKSFSISLIVVVLTVILLFY